MKSFRRLLVTVIVCMAVITVAANLILIHNNEGDKGRPYRVEAERIAYDIEHGKEIDLSGYKYVKEVVKLETLNDLSSGDSDHMVKVINGEIYLFDYTVSADSLNDKELVVVNICLGIVFVFLLLILLYIRHRIIKPFNRMTELPAELAKGNITAPIEAEKNKYFGDYIWGMNLLREKLAKDRQQDLESKKNNKSLILSLSHDIKTPLGIIELNSKALERGLYDNDKEKKDRIAGVINEKCTEIKSYVDQIIKASKDDVLELDVNNKEFYLSEVLNSIKSVYLDKLELLQTQFSIGAYSDCMLKGDPDRAVEVIQNLLENAIKYGDGKEVSITFSREENSQLISVVNTGCTLKDTELPHIFDSFWRGSNTGANAGSGLGLYICRQLMNRMGGEIFAEIKDGTMIVTTVFPMA